MITLPKHGESKELIKLLNDSLKGSKIVGIFPPTMREHIFILRVEFSSGETQDIEIGATELGWWLSSPFVGNHKLMKMKSLLRGEDCEMCELCHGFPEDENFNPSTCPGDY